MKVTEIKEKLNDLNIEYDENAKKTELETLLDQHINKDDSETENETETENDLVAMVSKSVKVEEKQAVVEKNTTVDILKKRNYGMLTRAQRAIVRENADEYQSAESGKTTQVTDRITNNLVKKVSDGKYYSFKPGKEYVISESDYELLKDSKSRVKTEATKHLCCGKAKYEVISSFEDVD